MLRRKMLIFLTVLVGLLVAASGGAIWMLQDVLGALDHTNGEDATVVETSNRMGTEINEIEIELRAIQIGRQRHLDTLLDRLESLEEDKGISRPAGGGSPPASHGTAPAAADLLVLGIPFSIRGFRRGPAASTHAGIPGRSCRAEACSGTGRGLLSRTLH